MALPRRALTLVASSALVLGTLAASPHSTVVQIAASGKAAERTKSRAAPEAHRVLDPAPQSGTSAASERCADCRFTPLVTMVPVVFQQPVSAPGVPTGGAGGIAGACTPLVSTWTNADFGGGSYTAQAGFSEGERAGASYTAPASAFPIKIDVAEMIFATSNATVTTTTEWSIHFYEGTPDSGRVVASFFSDGEILPHLVLPPGTQGANIQFFIDPSDPEQIIIQDNGSHTFSVAYGIEKHHNQTQNPCFFAPPTNSNAFPTTDINGLQAPNNNWLFALNCPFGCPAGWTKFAQLPGGCKPSGDWVMRVTWSPTSCDTVGACCLPDGDCETLTIGDCQGIGGTYMGDNTTCGPGTCQSASVACCFESTGGCLNFLPQTCIDAGGVPGPAGSNCTGFICFPQGACCLPDGTCAGPMSPAACAAEGGVFQGHNSMCAGTECPQPMGACCFPNGFCALLNEGDCAQAGASWKGAGTTCVDGNGDGTADACQAAGNPADLNNDGHVDAADLAILLGAWGQTSGAADINDDGIVNASDLSILLGAWG